MTLDDALKTQAALEAALLSGGSTAEVVIGDRRVKYQTVEEIRAALAEVTRSICRANRRARGISYPGIVTPAFKNYA